MAAIDREEWGKQLKNFKNDPYDAIMDYVKNGKITRFEFEFLVRTELIAPVVMNNIHNIVMDYAGAK